MSHNLIDKKRFRALSWMGVTLFAAAGVSQARLQVFQRDEIIARANKTDRFIVSRPSLAKRGGILDREGRPLAQVEDTRFLTMCFDKTPKSPGFYLELAAATGIPASEFATMSASKAPVDWTKPLGSAQATAVLDVKQKWRADGVGLSPSGRRSYPLGEAASGFLGAMRGKIALSGVELGMNKTLAGLDGRTVGIVDREGNYLPMRLDKQTVRRKDGATLTLTIDSELQQAAAEALKHAVDSNKADHGVAIVMDPKTGNILALANWPSFDPNRAIEPATKGRTPEFNGAYMAALEPGSTFKVLTLAKALDEGVVQANETYYCRGTMAVGKRTIGCDREHGSHGMLDTEGAIARSCNLAAANWAMRVGSGDFATYMEDLGLMDKPGLGLPQESRGLYDYKDYSKSLQLANNGFGQAMNYTPLALCSAFCMLGNEGKRVYPRLISKIDDKEEPIREGKAIVSPETSQTVLHMMRAVIDSDRGTGKALRIPGYAFGGKTGTAQKTNFTTRSMKGGGHVSNFIGFVPAEKPQAVILVMIDNPKAGIFYGGAVAGPVYKTIAQNVIRKLHVARADGRGSDLEVETERISGPRVASEPSVVSDPEPRQLAPKIQISARRITQERPQSKPRTSETPVSRVRPRQDDRPINRDVKPVVKRTTKATLMKAEAPKRTTKAAVRTIRIIEPEPKKRTVTKAVRKADPKLDAERPADLQTRKRSAVKLEGGLSPRIGSTSTRKTTKPSSAKAKGTTTKPEQRRVSRVDKPDQSPVAKKRVNRDQ